MANIATLLTEHMDIWTAAESEKKSGRGRASGSARSVYGVKKLRGLILEFAVRGKLVPQDLNDEPASELLKRIQAEKAKLSAEGKLKKERSLAPISEDEKPFELPRGWVWTTLLNVAVVNPRNNASDDINVSFVPMSLIGSDFNEKHQDEKRLWKDIKQGFTHFAEGDIGVAKITPCFENSKACVFENLENGLGAGTTELHIVRPISYTLNPRYVLAYFKSPKFLEVGEAKMTGTAGQKRLPKEFVESNLFPLPPLSEQHRIVVKVDELMALCDQLEQQHGKAQEAHQTLVSQLLVTLTQSQTATEFNANWQRIYAHFDVLFTTEASINALKQTLLQLAVMGKLVPQDPNDEPVSELLKRIQVEKAKLIAEGNLKKEKPLAPIKENEKPFELPKGWEWVRFQDISTYIQRGKGPEYVDHSEYLVISQKCVRWDGLDLSVARYISPESMKKYEEVRFLKNNDLLWNSTGTGTIGRACLYQNPESKELAVADSHVTIVRTIFGVEQFLFRYIQSPLVQNEIEEMASGTTNQIELNTSTVISHLLPLPPLPEQRRIVAKVDKLMSLCDQLKTRVQHANRQQQAIADSLVAQGVA